MRRYETICIIRPGIGDDGINSIIDRTTDTITSHDGSMVKINKWGLKKLAYPIKKEQQGYYVYLEYAGVPEAVAEIERVFRIDDKVIKYMTIKSQDVFSHLDSDDVEEQEQPEEAESEEDEASEEESEEAEDTDD